MRISRPIDEACCQGSVRPLTISICVSDAMKRSAITPPRLSRLQVPEPFHYMKANAWTSMAIG